MTRGSMNVTIEAEALDAARGGVLVVDGYWRLIPSDTPPDPYDVEPVAPVEFVKLTEPCKACDGSGHATFGNQVRTSEKCPACDGSGRPWLTVEWESSDVAPIYLGHPMTDSFRAHVLNVVPIYKWEHPLPEHWNWPCILLTSSLAIYASAPDQASYSVTLPPGDHVGRYAVLIKPEES